jgi:hypothetical protein
VAPPPNSGGGEGEGEGGGRKCPSATGGEGGGRGGGGGGLEDGGSPGEGVKVVVGEGVRVQPPRAGKVEGHGAAIPRVGVGEGVGVGPWGGRGEVAPLREGVGVRWWVERAWGWAW